MEGWNEPTAIKVPRPTVPTSYFKEFDILRMTDEEDKKRIFDGLTQEFWQKKIINSLNWHFGNSP